MSNENEYRHSEEKIMIAQYSLDKANKHLGEVKGQFVELKGSLDGIKKIDDAHPLVALTEQCVAGLEVFIAERSKILDGQKEWIQGARKCLQETETKKNPH